MTNEELLQQAKDKVAEETRLGKPWSKIIDDNHTSGHFIERLMDHVCKKAIQSAREEAAPKWTFTSDAIPEPSSEDPDNSYYVLGSKGWSYAPMVVYYSYISREFMSRETNAPVKGILFWTALPDQPGINEKGKLTAPGR